VLWTGDGEDTKAIAASNFVMDFTWIKNRDAAENNVAWDRVRGTAKRLVVNGNNAEADISSDGNEVEFTVAGMDVGSTNAGYEGEVNKLDDDYVAWNWKAGGTAASNTDGTVTSSVSANPTAGFSIVKYAGNNTSGATVGHGLSETPELIIIKNTEATVDWIVYSEPVGPTKGLQLNGTGDAYDYLAYFNDTSPTSSVFSLGDYSGVNADTKDFIAYCFHSVEGYSKIGSYVGNNNADGIFVYTGMKPAFVIVKRLADEGWQMFDSTRSPYNVAVDSLTPNGNGAERTDLVDVDIVSNGFKFRGTDGSCNAADDYIYIAFAESPFKTSNAR
jgi:hypothetical protein